MNNDTRHCDYMLMYTISTEPLPTMIVNIHNQCSDFKLTNGGYFSSDADWNKYRPRLDTDDIMSAYLISFMSTFEGVLTYELQSRYVKPGNRSEPTCIRLFVAWKSEGYKKFRVFVHMIECNKKIDWNRIKLEEYYQRYTKQLCAYTNPIKDTWLIDDDIVLMTVLGLDFSQRDGKLNITISEGIKDSCIKRPERINSEM
jgi:hypothetical protein